MEGTGQRTERKRGVEDGKRGKEILPPIEREGKIEGVTYTERGEERVAYGERGRERVVDTEWEKDFIRILIV